MRIQRIEYTEGRKQEQVVAAMFFIALMAGTRVRLAFDGPRGEAMPGDARQCKATRFDAALHSLAEARDTRHSLRHATLGMQVQCTLQTNSLFVYLCNLCWWSFTW